MIQCNTSKKQCVYDKVLPSQPKESNKQRHIGDVIIERLNTVSEKNQVASVLLMPGRISASSTQNKQREAPTPMISK